MLGAISFYACDDAGVTGPNSFDDDGGRRTGESLGTPIDCNAFGRAVWLVRDNERLFAALQATTLELRRARAYMADPGANPTLARVQLDRIRVRRSGLLAHLRANRIEAQALLGARPRAGSADDAIGSNP